MVMAAFIVYMSIIPAFSAPQPRAIVKDGTVKTADGQLIRGMSLHVSKTYSWAAVQWGLQKSNIQNVRDKLHMNSMRLNCLDPRAVVDGRPSSAFSTIAEEAVYTDSIVALAGEVGLYIILNYHCWGMVYDETTWDIRNFWDFYAPRYKDKTWILYEIENEPEQGDPPSGGANAWPTSNEADLYKNHVRKWAPNTLILTGMEVMELVSNWGPYLRDVYAPACGFSWTSGKDAWPWHPYGGTNATAIKATQASGIPMIMTESSYWEEGFGNAIIDGCHYPIEWAEKNGISWLDWHLWNRADQLATPLNYLIPDAVAKGYAWWTGTPVIAKQNKAKETARSFDFISHARGMIQANGRITREPMSTEENRPVLTILPRRIRR
jgi:hypothetical protein